MYKILGADQREYGPVTADQLRQWITEGRANSQTMVQGPDSTEWKPLSSFAEFAGVMPAGRLAPAAARTFGGKSRNVSFEPRAITTPCSIAVRSSRTFPGQL